MSKWNVGDLLLCIDDKDKDSNPRLEVNGVYRIYEIIDEISYLTVEGFMFVSDWGNTVQPRHLLCEWFIPLREILSVENYAAICKWYEMEGL